MQHYQDTETGMIHAFDDGFDPLVSSNRNIPRTLSREIKQKPDDAHVWHNGEWIKPEKAPPDYIPPISGVPSYNPAWIAHLCPYTAIYKDATSGLGITLDQINANTYPGEKLAEVVASLHLGNPTGMSALVSYDGAIALPQCDDFPDKINANSKLNELFCSLLIGGVHAEVVHSEKLVIGSLQEKTSLFSYTHSLHSSLRLNWAALADRIVLLSPPRILMVEDMRNAFNEGQRVINAIGNFSPLFLLGGYTAMVYRNNSDSLNNLWITVEQLTEHLWVNQYHKQALSTRVRRCQATVNKQIQADQIWAKQRQLRLAKIISKACHKALSMARQARNELVHHGIIPSAEIIELLWRALPELLEAAAGIAPLGIRKLGGGGVENSGITKRTDFKEWIELAKTV
jgi:hypothetical protein